MDDLFLDPLPHTWMTPSPHRNSGQSGSKQAVADDSSVDLYADLSMSSIRCDQSQSSPEKQAKRHFSKVLCLFIHYKKKLSFAKDIDLYIYYFIGFF